MLHPQRCFSNSLWSLFSFATALWISNANAESWEGFNKIEFQIEARKAFLIEPKSPAEGRPWIWRTEFFGHQPQADIALLNRGFFVAYVDVQNLYGGPLAMSVMDAMYARLTAENHLSKRTVLEGFSRGGLFTINWAARNPSKVACIYNDAPVCDFTSWPAGKGRGKGSIADWERLKKVYALSEEEALASKLNPIHQLAILANAKVPLLHVCGASDDVVPIEENSLLVQQKYRELGGPMILISKPHCNHHPHSLVDPTRIVNFVLTHTGFVDQQQEVLTPFGYDYSSLRDGLQKCRVVFEKTGRGRVAFLGGSITASKGWRDHVCDDLKRRFPSTEFDFISAGLPSMGSTPGAFRFSRDVLAKGPVDLLFEEAAVNDDTNGFSDIEQVRGMEGIVRQALLSNPQMDVVLLHFADPGKITEIRNGKTPSVISNHERVAEHYRIPSINLAKEVTERIGAGEFTWEADFRDLHPSPFGHTLYAKSIGRMFDEAWVASKSSQQTTSTILPPPADKSSYFMGRLANPLELLETSKLKLISGWKIDKMWKPEGQAGTRVGFVNVPALIADQPGDTMQLTFTGSGIGLFVAAGPDTGRAEYRMDGGEWTTLELFTQWSPGLHLPWAKMLASDLTSSEHVLELRVRGDRDPRSKGHAIRIMHFLVNGPIPDSFSTIRGR